MKRSELQALVGRLKETSLGVADSQLEIERQQAADYYYGRNFQPAPEGRSQFVDRTLMDTVEWIMPQVMGVFASTDELVNFDPVGPEDEELAEQETAYTNHVLLKKNDGFLTLHDAVKDALLFRNGYIKVHWEEREKTTVESYKGLMQDEFAKLQADYEQEDADVEVIEEEGRTEELPGPEGMIQVPVLDVKLRVTTKQGELVSEAVPPEEIIVSEDAAGRIKDLPFIGHLTTKTRTDLIEMGMKRTFVEDLPAYGLEDDEDSTAGRRDPLLEDDPSVALDASMDEIEYLEAYIKVDYDDDGKAELRKVVAVAGKIPDGEEWIEEIDCVPLVYGVPVRTPHRHIGTSLFDLLREIQEIRTTLFRQMLDNVYLTNNQRPVVNENVNLRDLAVSKPGSPIRIRGKNPVGNDLGWASPNPIMQQLIPVLDVVDNIKEQRTGVGRNNTNIDPDVLRNAPDALVQRAQNAANAKIEMIIRLIAETLVKDWVRLGHKYLIKYSDKPAVFKLRGNYIQIDPREWKDRDDLSVSVGLGTGSEEEKQGRLALLAQVMEKAATVGIVLPENIYNYAEDASKTLGFKQPSRYFTDPGTPEFQQRQQQQQQAQQQQAQQDFQQQMQLLTSIEQVKGQYRQQSDQIKAQGDAAKAGMKARQDMASDRMKLQAEDRRQMRELAFKLRELLNDREIDIAKMEVEAFIEGASVDIGEPGIGGELSDGEMNGR